MSEIIEYKLPAHWAGAMVNGDYSGLTDEDERSLNAWNKARVSEHGPLFMCIDVGEAEFGYPCVTTGELPGDVAIFVFQCDRGGQPFADWQRCKEAEALADCVITISCDASDLGDDATEVDAESFLRYWESELEAAFPATRVEIDHNAPINADPWRLEGLDEPEMHQLRQETEAEIQSIMEMVYQAGMFWGAIR